MSAVVRWFFKDATLLSKESKFLGNKIIEAFHIGRKGLTD